MAPRQQCVIGLWDLIKLLYPTFMWEFHVSDVFTQFAMWTSINLPTSAVYVSTHQARCNGLTSHHIFINNMTDCLSKIIFASLFSSLIGWNSLATMFMSFAFSVRPSAAITSESFCAILWGYSKSWQRCEAKRAEGLISIHSWALLLTTQSAFCVSLFSVSSELYGWTTTSLISSWFGNTEYVCTSFFGYLEIKECILFSVKTFSRSVVAHARNKTLTSSNKLHVHLWTCHWVSPADRIRVPSPFHQQWSDTGQIPMKTKGLLITRNSNLQLQHVPRVYKA